MRRFDHRSVDIGEVCDDVNFHLQLRRIQIVLEVEQQRLGPIVLYTSRILVQLAGNHIAGEQAESFERVGGMCLLELPVDAPRPDRYKLEQERAVLSGPMVGQKLGACVPAGQLLIEEAEGRILQPVVRKQLQTYLLC